MEKLGGMLAAWPGVTNLSEEIQLACVPANFSNTNFTPGDVFFGTGNAGEIGRLSADTHSFNLTWLTLTEEPTIGRSLRLPRSAGLRPGIRAETFETGRAGGRRSALAA